MLKAEDLEHQQQNPATVEATNVGNVAANVTNQDRGGPQSPPSYSIPAPSRFYYFQSFEKTSNWQLAYFNSYSNSKFLLIDGLFQHNIKISEVHKIEQKNIQ